jgi:hypothetical protein
MNEREPLRDALGLVLAHSREDISGYTKLADRYELGEAERALVSSLAGLATKSLSIEETAKFALHLGSKR